jgi:hypothetical protein
MESSRKPPAGDVSTFNQRAEKARSEVSRRLFYWVLVGPGALLLLISLYSLWTNPAWWSLSGPGTVVGVAILGLGLVIIPTIARRAANPLVELSLDDLGIRLKFQRGPDRSFEWNDPKLHGIISPPWVGSASGVPKKNTGPWYVTLVDAHPGSSYTVTSEAGASIVERATRVGARVTTSPIGTVTFDGTLREGHP